MRVVKIGDISSQIRGVSYKKADVSREPKQGSIPVLRANNIVEGEICLNDLVYISSNNIRDVQYLRRGDVIIAASSGSLSVVGKAATVRNDMAAAFGAFCKVIRPNQEVWPSYFSNYFQTRKYRDRVSSLAAGANINNLRNEHIDNLEIPLPPLDEQKRIAAILDKADSLRVKRRAALAKLDALVQSVFLEMFGDPVTNPMGWEVVKLGDIGNWQSGGTPSRERSEYYTGIIPWLSSGELEQLYTYDSIEHITDDALRESSTKEVEPGSLLLGMYDTAALKSTITQARCTCNQAIAFSKLDEEKAQPEYVYFAVQIARDFFRRQQRGARQKNLNLSMIRNIAIPLPSRDLQVDFLQNLNQITSSKSIHEAAVNSCDTLFHSLQQRAFRGEL